MSTGAAHSIAAIGLVEITPSDSADLAKGAVRALNVTADGNVKVTMMDGSVGTVYIIAGVPFPVRAVRVWATGTTATGIVGFY